MIRTKKSDKPTSFIRWSTMSNAKYRIYRVLKADSELVEGIYIGSLYHGKFIPFLGRTKPVVKRFSEYIDYCTLTRIKEE